MTKLEIIDETVAYYSEDTSRRSINNHGRCVYKNALGNYCALSRCADKEWLNYYYEQSVNEPRFIDVFNRLLPEYKGHDDDFWSDIQALHDTKNYWDENGLTEFGVDRVELLKERYND